MSAQAEWAPRLRFAAGRWVVAGLVLYGAWLTYIFSTVAFDEENAARQFVEQVANRPPGTIPPSPTIAITQRPDIAMSRDPFLPSAGKQGTGN